MIHIKLIIKQRLARYAVTICMLNNNGREYNIPHTHILDNEECFGLSVD